jgi:replicative DNA helicase
LAQDLHVDPQSLKIAKTTPTTDVILPRKVVAKHHFTKYVNAEIYLILAMLLSKDHHKQITKKIKANESAEKLNGLLRMQITQYYERHDTMDLNMFLDQLTEDLRQHFIDVIQKNILYGKIKSVAEGDIDQHIRVLKDIGMARRLAHLIDEIGKLPEDHPKRVLMVEEKDQLQRKLKHSK